jgi:hypothetical protein
MWHSACQCRHEMTINPAWAEHADRDVVIVISRLTED